MVRENIMPLDLVNIGGNRLARLYSLKRELMLERSAMPVRSTYGFSIEHALGEKPFSLLIDTGIIDLITDPVLQLKYQLHVDRLRSYTSEQKNIDTLMKAGFKLRDEPFNATNIITAVTGRLIDFSPENFKSNYGDDHPLIVSGIGFLLQAKVEQWNVVRAKLLMKHGQLRYIDLTGIDLSCLNLYGIDLRDVLLRNAHMRETLLWRAAINDSHIIESDLAGAKFSGTVRDTLFQKNNLSRTDFGSTNLCRSTFTGNQYWDADFRSAVMSNAVMSLFERIKAQLMRANFGSAFYR